MAKKNAKTQEKPKIDSEAFDDVMNRLNDFMPRQPAEKPVVSPKTLENAAKWMMKFGYEFNKHTLKILEDYLKGYNLYICGGVGKGKTYFFDCMSRFRKSRGMTGIQKLSMIETQGWTMTMAREWLDEMRDYDVLIDDLGTEPVMKSWGQTAEVFPYILERRMNIQNRRTHVTSNMSILDIRDRYGERIKDRFVQYFRSEEIDLMDVPKSRRVLSQWRKPANQGDGIL